MTRPASETGELAGTAPQMLKAALNMAGARVTDADMAKAHTILRDAGTTVSIRKNGERERDPAFAPHTPNISDLSANFSYSAEGSPGHDECCAGCERWLYLGDRAAARIPWIHGIVTAKNGRTEITAALMSERHDTRRVLISWEEIADGTWGRSLGIGLTPDHKTVTAVAAAIIELAYDNNVPRLAAAVTPAARTEDGHIPEPVTECMPDGYWAQPATAEAERLQARASQAEIAARRPKIALTWGASVGAAFAGPLRLRQSGIWELVGGPRLGKTTTLMLAASAWGCPEFPPDGMLMSWDQTSKGTGRHLGELGIFPAFMDETGTADFGPDEWARLAYSLSLGASRQTAKTRGSMGTNRTPGWQGFLFTTGNGTITENATAGKFAGVAARVVTLSGEFTAGPDECKQLDAAVLADYGHIGPAVIKALTVAEFGEMYRAALDLLTADPGGIAGTLAAKAALGVAGARAIDLVLGTGTRIGDAAHRAALDYLANLDPAETDRERILRRIGELLSAEKMSWPDAAKYSGDQYRSYSGVTDDTWVYVYPSTWREITESTGVGNSAKLALADMYARGELHVPDSRRKRGEWHAQSPQWSGPVRVYKVALAAVRDTGLMPDAGTSDAGADAGDAGTRTSSNAGTAPTLTSNDAGYAGDAGQTTLPTADTAPDAGYAGTRIEGNAGTAPTLTSVDAGYAGDAGQTTLPTAQPLSWSDEPGAAIGDIIGAPVNPTAISTEHQDHAPETKTRVGDFGSAAAPTTPMPSEPREGHPMTTPTTERSREQQRRAWLAATWKRPDNARRGHFKTEDQREALASRAAMLDENPGISDKDAVRSLGYRLRVLDQLEGTGTFGKDWHPGPFMPKLGAHGKQAALKPWKDGLPPCIEMARVIEGYDYQRDDYRGPVAVFDRNGAWVGSAGTALVAHGGLERTGECDPAASGTAPGYYLMTVYPWTESGMPSPFDNAEVGTDVWVPAPIAGLLAELANAGRWPDATASDSWTGTPTTLDTWGRFIRELRRYALETYGYPVPGCQHHACQCSGAYQAAKDAISMSLAMWAGTLADDTTRPIRKWKLSKGERIDWRHQIITNSAVSTWRTMDRCLTMADGKPELAPIGIRNKDELIIPDNGAAELFTTTPYRGGKTPPVRLDNTGVGLGTWKLKDREDWPAS